MTVDYDPNDYQLKYYDKEGKPLKLLEWAKLNEDRSYKRIRSTKGETHWVSTVWLGLDHAFMGGPPLIFETMVFPVHEGVTDGGEADMIRCSTEAQAIINHNDMVRKWIELTPALCLCTLDEYMDGHRCRCPHHAPCGECDED